MLETHLIKKKHLFRNPHKIYALCRQYPEKCAADGLIFLSKSQLPRIGAFAVQVNITQHLWWHFSVSNIYLSVLKGFVPLVPKKESSLLSIHFLFLHGNTTIINSCIIFQASLLESEITLRRWLGHQIHCIRDDVAKFEKP